MAKPNFNKKQEEEKETEAVWGTWEDLLLAFAVSRHGTASWDSVAADLRSRAAAASSLSLLLLTPLSCEHKFLDLRRRFDSGTRNAAAEDDDDSQGPEVSVPFLDELRRLRVDELRREVRRRDLSIVSLETKVEILKEERNQSLKEVGKERAAKPDLRREEIGKDEEDAVRPGYESSPENKVSGEGSVRDERSENESNSSDLKIGGPKPAEKDSDRSEPAGVGKPREESFGGSSDSAAKEGESEKVEPEKLGGDSEEEVGTKEACSGEVQSSRSLSRKIMESEPDEPDRSVETMGAHSDVESQPLVGFLEILRCHKSGSFFERRLDVQETPSYNNMIRQHVDFETIRNRAEEGRYSGCKSEFFRDIMLVLSNAAVFFGKKSPESTAAVELRPLVRKEMMAQSITTATTMMTATKTTEEEEEEDGAGASPDTKPEQPKPTPASLARKPKISVPLNACRKQSVIASRTPGPERKKEEAGTEPKLGGKKVAEESPAAKKGRKDRPRTTARSSAAAAEDKNDNESSASRSEKEKEKEKTGGGGGKKRSATDFLNRLKRGSPSADTSKDSEGRKAAGYRKKERPAAAVPSARRKQAKEPESPVARRSGARPGKRSAAAVSPASAPLAKRSRASGEAEAGGSSTRSAKKRARK